MEENLLLHGGELDYHIFKMSNAPRLARAKSRYYKERQVDRKKRQAIRW